MKTHFFKRGIAGLLSLVMCLSAFIGLGTTTAFAAGEQAEVYLISFPRSGDANLDYSGTWGHSNLHYMNGWYSGESKYTTIRAMHSYDGNICYCIEPGTPQDTGDRYTSKDETFWDNLPSDFNSTISPYDMKLFIGRIMQYGYTGPISTSWRSQNASDAETLAQAMATQVLIWETVVGERDEDFNHISPGSYDAVKSVVSTAHPLYSQFISYYNSIEASVQRHSAIPSFMAKTPGKAQNVELAWNGTNYTATLTDSNNVLSNYSFSANEDGISFSVSGNKLVITAATAPSDSVRITASKSGATRRGIITWTDGRYAPGSGIQDVISYAQEVNDPVQAFLNLKVSYGSAKIIKTSEDGKVDNLTFTVTGNGVNQTVKTNAKGEIQMTNNFTPKKSGTAARPQLSPEEYAAKKKAEKDAVYQMIDDTATEIVRDPDKFRAYLDTQARMDRYSAANALLIYKQQPQATQLKDFRDWQEDGVKVNKGAKSLSILEPVEYTKNDGSTGIAYNVKKVFDVAQTSGKKPAAPTLDRDPRKLVAIMLDTAPIDVSTVEELPSPNMGAFYKNEDQTLYIKRDIGDSVALCQCVAQELGHAQLAMNCEAYSRRDMGFSAVCVGYMLCRKFGVDVKNFAIDRIPEELAGKSPKEIRAELSKTRSAMSEIGSRVSEEIYRRRADRSKDQER